MSSIIDDNAKSENNTGFGTNANSYGGRFVNKDGTANVEKRGLNFFKRISWHHTLIDLPLYKFLGILLVFYILINFFFSTIYYLNGIEYLKGIDSNLSEINKFGKAFFFSTQTFTTVGYGHISPNGFFASTISSIEALTGLLSFAIATGLFYGRFSKPTAYIKFSKNALIAPYKDKTALMLRMVPFKNTNFTDAEAKITLGIEVEENGILVNKFYTLKLELAKVNTLTLSWTLVHPIDEESPLNNFTKEDFENLDGEIMVFVKTFDDMFSNTVAINTSYTFKEVVYGAKFDIMYDQNKSNTHTILYLDKLNSYTRMEI
jgi:inward rectifier potassium channel